MSDYHALLVAELERPRPKSETKIAPDPTFKTLKSPFEPFEGEGSGCFNDSLRQLGEHSIISSGNFCEPDANDNLAVAMGRSDKLAVRSTGQFGHLLPGEYALPIANLSNSHAPGDFDAARWQQVLDGMTAFCAEWGSRAAALGWQVPELFGLDDRAPAARHDRRGLALSLAAGARVVAIDANGADVEMPSGSHLRFYRRRGQ